MIENIKELIDDIVSEVSFRTDSGLVDFRKADHIYILSEVLTEMGLGGVKDELISALMEADEDKPTDEAEDDKYSHKAYGYYVKKGDEEKEDAQVFTKQDGRYVPSSPEEYEKAAAEQGEKGASSPTSDKAKDSGGVEQQAEPELGTALKADTEGGKSYNDSLPDGDPAKIKKDKPKSVKKKKKLSKEEVERLKSEYSKKSEIAENLVSDRGKSLSNGTIVRDILDNDGNPIDVKTTEGRKKAAETIRERLNSFDKKIQNAIENFGQTIEVKKWLGEVGEMSALAQILENDVEAYLLTDSERKNDIVFIKSDGDESALHMGYLSVKTTLEGEQVNQLGANCKADLEKLSESGKENFETTINGKKFDVTPSNVLGSVIDIKSAFFAKFSLKDGVKKTSKGKLTEINSERHANVSSEDIIDINGKKYFKDQSAYLRNTPVTEEDINEFFDKDVDKFLNNLSKPKKGSTNQITDTKEKEQTKQYLKETFLSDMRRKKENGEPYSLYDMHDTMHYVIGKTIQEAEMSVEATTDTMAIEFTEETINPKVSVITKEAANKDIQSQLDKNKEIDDERERQIDKSKNCVNIRSRTRAVGKPLRYDGIDNTSPISKKPTEDRIDIGEYVRS